MESSQKQCRDVLVVLRTAPKALLAGYFVNAFILSFPMVAMADWLNNHIEMPLATQAQFYAFVFVPNCFKPLYASLANVVAKWISGSSSEARSWLRGRSRSLVLQVCGLCMGVLYVLACRVSTVSGAFGLFFAINIFSSCAEMMLGALLMELAHHGKRSAEDGQGNGGGGGDGSMMQDAGAIQALAGGTRSLGSVSAVRAFVCACMWANLPVLFSKIFPPIY